MWVLFGGAISVVEVVELCKLVVWLLNWFSAGVENVLTVFSVWCSWLGKQTAKSDKVWLQIGKCLRFCHGVVFFRAIETEWFGLLTVSWVECWLKWLICMSWTASVQNCCISADKFSSTHECVWAVEQEEFTVLRGLYLFVCVYVIVGVGGGVAATATASGHRQYSWARMHVVAWGVFSSALFGAESVFGLHLSFHLYEPRADIMTLW